ncbi:MAG: hypothetical protein PUJ60_02440 [bacterium]|nr:hypothetical protein [bacterium]MDY4108289.1 hypothetical protein [Bacilli bacterium]
MKYENTFKIIFIFLFVIFLTMYISVGSNYYEYELHKKVMLTNEDIKKFEDDVKNNKEVDIDNYISSRVDYSNSFSKASTKVSKETKKYIKQGIEGIFNIFSKMFT